MSAKSTDLARVQEVYAYLEVDREIIWQVLHEDCDALLVACRAYCDDMGVDLE